MKITLVWLKTIGILAPGESQACIPPVPSATVAESMLPTLLSHQMPSYRAIWRNRRCRYGLSSTSRSPSRPMLKTSSSDGSYHSPQKSTARSPIFRASLKVNA
ncbi:hypothetical protein D9M72_544980 [compost metagenome]